MSSGFLRVSILAVLPVLAAGCGGTVSGSGSSGGSPTTVKMTFTPATPTAVAVQIGAGAYTTQTLSNGVLSFSLPSGTSTYAVAYICTPAPLTENGLQYATTMETVVEASTADATSLVEQCLYNLQSGAAALPPGPTAALAVSINASAIPSAASLLVVATNGKNGTQQSFSTASASGSFAAPQGTDRVEIFVLDTSGNLVAARNVPSQAVPGSLNGGTAIVLGAADETQPEAIAVNDVPAQFSSPNTGAWFNMGLVSIGTPSGPTQYSALPAAAMENGDSYTVFATTSPVVHSEVTQTVSGSVSSTSAGRVAINFPAPWSYAGPTPAARPTFDFSGYTAFAGQPGITYDGNLFWTDGTNGAIGTSQYFVDVSASANYLHGATKITVPNLSGLPGFLPTPPTGTDVSWGAAITQSSSGILTAPNSTSLDVANQGDYTEP
ncbi:MAG: hypothetical protein ACLGPM_03110 [Acidobacteriota bacterium]